MFSISCFEGSTCLANVVIVTAVTFKFVNTCRCVRLRDREIVEIVKMFKLISETLLLKHDNMSLLLFCPS